MGVLRRHKILASVGVVAAVGLGLIAWSVAQIDSPGPASVDDALDRLHQDGGDAGPDAAMTPPQGVYDYVGEGREGLSFPPLSQQDGDQIPGTVTHRPRGCWTFRIDFNAEHWQDWRYCLDTRGAGLAEVGGRSGQTWDLGVSQVSNESLFVCDPPSPLLPPPTAGTTTEEACTGTNSALGGETTSAGPSLYVGPDTITVDGEDLETLHFRGERTLTGAQEGTEHTESWFRADGLLVRYERDIEIRSDSPVGAITYTESGWLQLARLEPRR
jgi:hypothetical protein